MDFYLDIGTAVMLRVLKDRRLAREYRALFLKVYLAIGRAFSLDPEFHEAVEKGETWK